MKRKAEDQIQGQEKRGKAEEKNYEPSRSVFLGNIDPQHVSVFDIAALANQFGAIEQLRVVGQKKCAFLNFVEEGPAREFYEAAATEQPVFDDRGISSVVKWAKAPPLGEELKTAIGGGATRNLFVGNVQDSVGEDAVASLFARFGPFENIVLVRNKGYGFVNLASVASAIEAKKELDGAELAGRRLKVNFAQEKITPRPAPKPRRPPFVSKTLTPGWYESLQRPVPALAALAPPPPQQSMQSMPSHLPMPYGYAQPMPLNRGIFLSNINDDITLHDLCALANRFGALESLVVLRPKKFAFINFVEGTAALAMFATFSQHQNQLRMGENNTLVGVSWSRKMEPIPDNVAQALREGATRNLYVANVEPHITEELLREAFGPYCNNEFDNITFLREKKVAFVNLLSVKAALGAREALQGRQIGSPAVTLRVNFAKEVLGGGRAAAAFSQRRRSNKEVKGLAPGGELEPGTGGGEGGGSRCLYIGTLPDDVEAHDVCVLANQYGGIDELSMLPEKKCCFVAFLNWRAAAAMVDDAVRQPVVLRGKTVKINYAKGAPLDPLTIDHVRTGATRNLFVGGLPASATTDSLTRLFNAYGPFENIVLYSKKNCAFVNLLSLRKAIDAKNTLGASAVLEGATLKLGYAKEKTSATRKFEHSGPTDDHVPMGMGLPMMDPYHQQPYDAAYGQPPVYGTPMQDDGQQAHYGYPM